MTKLVIEVKESTNAQSVLSQLNKTGKRSYNLNNLFKFSLKTRHNTTIEELLTLTPEETTTYQKAHERKKNKKQQLKELTENKELTDEQKWQQALKQELI